MGNGLNHFNATKLGHIVATNARQLSSAAAFIREGVVDESQYTCSWEMVAQALEAAGIDSQSDLDILRDLFDYMDRMQQGQVDARELFAAFAILIPGSTADKVELAFTVVNPNMNLNLSKAQIHTLFGVINTTLRLLGDYGLSDEQVTTYVESIFISAGRIDGMFPYNEFLEIMLEHPITTMLLSPHYQRYGMRES